MKKSCIFRLPNSFVISQMNKYRCNITFFLNRKRKKISPLKSFENNCEDEESWTGCSGFKRRPYQVSHTICNSKDSCAKILQNALFNKHHSNPNTSCVYCSMTGGSNHRGLKDLLPHIPPVALAQISHHPIRLFVTLQPAPVPHTQQRSLVKINSRVTLHISRQQLR